jgi:hypothetical protein
MVARSSSFPPRKAPDESGDWYYDTRARLYVNDRTGEKVPEGMGLLRHVDTTTGVRSTDIYDFRPRYHCAYCGKGECIGCGSSEQVSVPAVPAKQPPSRLTLEEGKSSAAQAWIARVKHSHRR